MLQGRTTSNSTELMQGLGLVSYMEFSMPFLLFF